MTTERIKKQKTVVADIIERTTVGAVAVLTMKHKPHNLLGPILMAALSDSLKWAENKKARAIILRSGLRHFSAGAEMEAFDSHLQGETPNLPFVELLEAFDATPIPIIASVGGVCVGGGFELALASDFIIAGESAKIGSVEVTLGLYPLMGAIQRITQRAGAARAKELVMLGRRQDARTLERWNIINRVVADEQLDKATMTLANEFANGPTIAHATIKKLVSIAASEGVKEADKAMKDIGCSVWKSEDLKAGIASLNENGPGLARFKGN